ncbi:hypothetical protein UFOVP129_48 [uncultured Caudovirales phage]|uniref:Uncharacterized protein n=1 Tax=uncultured Caudovirales phage TaxID=2100421 RepID=A0A6J5L999_9CAUD|nr:hypothetical protein UFOVP129_48 [uncultured Caudovirales phage]
MDSFLFIGDYNKQMQSDALSQLIGGNNQILEGIQRAAVEECISYLKQKYDTDLEFEPVTKHDIYKVYKAENTVYLDATDYSATSTYALNAYTLYNGSVYQCTTAITVGEAFNPSKWQLLGLQNDLYYAVLPYDTFDYKKNYKVGDNVFWKNNTYTCKLPSVLIDHDAALQIGTANDMKLTNVFPDDPKNGVQYWGNPVNYNVLANTSLTNTTYWAQGDNRDQKLLMTCVDIALYHAHCRIAPRNIPDLRIHRYMGDAQDRETRGQRVLYPTYSALGWLQAAAIGNDITPELPLLQPSTGQRVRFGGNVKLNNTY